MIKHRKARTPKMPRICSIPNCGNWAASLGLCAKHYQRQWEERKKVKEAFRMVMSSEMSKLLDDLAARSGGSKGGALKKAIILLDVATREKDQGNKIGILDADDKLLQEIIIL